MIISCDRIPTQVLRMKTERGDLGRCGWRRGTRIGRLDKMPSYTIRGKKTASVFDRISEKNDRAADPENQGRRDQ